MTRPWGILAIAAALALSGCSVQISDEQDASGAPAPSPAESVAGGALALGGGLSATCADGTSHHAFLWGIPVVNRSGSEVRLMSAGIDTTPLELEGIWVVGPEVDDDDPRAATSWTADYPPADPLDEADWDDRTEVDGARISAHSSVWIAVALSGEGTASDLRLTYQDADGQHTVTDLGTYGIGRLADGEVTCA